MPNQLDCEQYLASCLAESWQARSVDRLELAKRLILSVKQLDALQKADPAPFHTHGIYLRAMRKALEEAQLFDDPEVLRCLEALESDHRRIPNISHVLQVKQTVNKKLAVAPPERNPHEATSPRSGIAVVLVLSVTMLLVLILALSQWIGNT